MGARHLGLPNRKHHQTMQFIDQSATYSKKSITLTTAIETERAKVTADPDAHKLNICFRPELEVANAFDAAIDARLRFFD